jgi:AhpD family alkylhydroperoxidase
MSKYRDIARSVDLGNKALADAAPEAMGAFAGLFRAASADGALDKKTKELMALAISVAIRCEGCIAAHARAAARHGATEAEAVEALMVAVELSGGPGTVYAGEALEAFREFA